MKFVSVQDLRAKSARIWRDLPEEGEMVVTSNGRPIAILSAVTESNLEKSLTAIRQARAAEAVVAIQRHSVATEADRVTDSDIDAEIAAVRRLRTR